MNNRTYERFAKEEFEQALEETDLEFEEKNYNWTGELIYEAKSGNGKFIIRVYSSLDKNTGRARDKGSDAIRTVVLHSDSERPVLKEKRTNRIKTWKKNLKQKIQNIRDRRDEIRVCEECGSIMVIRENSSNGDKFYGCASWPDCKNTKSLDQQ